MINSHFMYRPIAGFINICIRRAFHEGIYGLRSLLIHEITHSLVSVIITPAYIHDNEWHAKYAYQLQLLLDTMILMTLYKITFCYYYKKIPLRNCLHRQLLKSVLPLIFHL